MADRSVTGADGITVVVAREVAPGREDDFHRPPPRWKTFLMPATVILLLQTLLSALLRPLVGDFVSLRRLLLRGLLGCSPVLSVVVGAGRTATAVDSAAAMTEPWDAESHAAYAADLESLETQP